MKCDVCGTIIPIGRDDCPNCGYRYKVIDVKASDVSTVTHEHIKVDKAKKVTTMPKRDLNFDHINDRQTHQQKRQIRKNTKAKLNAPRKRTKSKKSFLPTIVFIIFLFSILTSLLPLFIFRMIAPSGDFSAGGNGEATIVESFEEAKDDDYDTVQLAIDEEDKVIAMMEEMGLKDITVYERAWVYENYTQANVSIYGYGDTNDYSYCVEYAYIRGNMNSKEVTLNFSLPYTVREKSDFQVNTDRWQAFSQYLSVDIYNIFNTHVKDLTVDENDEDRYVYSDYGEIDIYFAENKHSDQLYSYYLSIGI